VSSGVIGYKSRDVELFDSLSFSTAKPDSTVRGLPSERVIHEARIVTVDCADPWSERRLSTAQIPAIRALAEAPIYGHYFAHRPGHRLNNALLRELFYAQRRLEPVELREDPAMPGAKERTGTMVRKEQVVCAIAHQRWYQSISFHVLSVCRQKLKATLFFRPPALLAICSRRQVIPSD